MKSLCKTKLLEERSVVLERPTTVLKGEESLYTGTETVFPIYEMLVCEDMTCFRTPWNVIVFACDLSLVCEVGFAWLQRSHWTLAWQRPSI